jgi:two-component system sensor histidine kinase KdpD
MGSPELRTPLLHIKGFVSTLLESDIEWDEPTKLEFLHTIDREVDRLAATVSDLMEISRMGSGDLPLHLEYADPYLLAYAALDSSSLFAHKHRVIIDVPEHLPKIRVDVLKVTGVLVNLIENATKYSEKAQE